ncbi:SpoIIE family protein phosphatase [Streptomyces canus]|uniref:SpoIIE family protein phosphatase n=1 Tax=Streptomyces canus TaxID=58343 RepID=UPI00278A4D57|nr:SpoIIE family protein phosphatase [Streptomyces canus]MDQ1069497.1 hypothetical protein [Streptomyces canus]
MVVGDVRGKGMGPVAAVASVIAVFREAVEEETIPTPTRAGTRRDSVEAFEELTTAVLAELPHGDGVVRIVSRGQPPRTASTSGSTTPGVARRPTAFVTWRERVSALRITTDAPSIPVGRPG